MNERIRFEKPDIGKLRSEGLTCVDMHYHTYYSDSYTRPEDALKLAEKMNVGVAITDHNQVHGMVDAFKSGIDVPIVPGIEISASDGPHILAYFYDWKELETFWELNIKDHIRWCQWIALKDLPTVRILDLLEKENCVVSAAHPAGYLGSNKGLEVCVRKNYIPKSEATRFDALEVISGGLFRGANIRAAEIAEKYNFGITGGTDGHLLTELGDVVTVSEADDLDMFLDNIVKRRSKVIGKEKNLMTKALMGLASLVEFCRHTPSVGFVQLDQTIMNARRRINPPVKESSELARGKPGDGDSH